MNLKMIVHDLSHDPESLMVIGTLLIIIWACIDLTETYNGER